MLAILTVVVCMLLTTGSALAKKTKHTVWPRHHLLWDCISKNESRNWYNHGPGHYGGLQMSWNWLGLISGDAGNYPRIEQEWAAETGYRNSGYTYSFLYRQWFEWDDADYCVKYA